MNIEEIISQMPKGLRDAYHKANDVHIDKIPLASIGLNKALGGGIGKGCMTLIYGGFSSGKTLLMLSSIALNQREDPDFTALWVDTEKSFTTEWAQRIGVDTDRLIVVQRNAANAVTDLTVPVIKAGVDLVVIDSISQIIPSAFVEEDGELKEFDRNKQVGAHAKSITVMVNAFNYVNENTAVVLLSQTTTNLSGMHPRQDPHGGKKVQFAATQMIKLSSSNTEANQIKGDMHVNDKIVNTLIGRKVTALVEKNKLGKPFEKADYDLYYAGDFIGVDLYGELIDAAVNLGIIEKGGAWLKYGDHNIQGRAKFVELVKDDAILFEKIKGEVESAGL